MAITDELRKWARDNTVQDKVLTTYPVQHPVHGTVESLLRIADSIDAEHEEALLSARNHGYELGCEDAYEAAYQDGENAILAVFDKRGSADVDERMAEHGWYRALDADKRPIHLGDVMVCCDRVREVAGVGKDCFFAWSGDDGCLHQYDALLYSHYEPLSSQSVGMNLCAMTGASWSSSALPSCNSRRTNEYH